MVPGGAEKTAKATAATTAVTTAGTELATLVKNEILAKGGKYVAVTTLIDMSKTPEAVALPDAIRPLLNVLPQTFELWLRDGLGGQPVQLVTLLGDDAFGQLLQEHEASLLGRCFEMQLAELILRQQPQYAFRHRL